ncbi:hypothetical protein PR048_021374 [Dryococelus australis]|uniref:Uncharacterized protein n=1 Tax=Dryococelus australis TaxID=614101 RepID=A0ABQ9GY09_9NEOP|nr:hypothetical protein PR048_021374 [Dryococelus australis]
MRASIPLLIGMVHRQEKINMKRTGQMSASVVYHTNGRAQLSWLELKPPPAEFSSVPSPMCGGKDVPARAIMIPRVECIVVGVGLLAWRDVSNGGVGGAITGQGSGREHPRRPRGARSSPLGFAVRRRLAFNPYLLIAFSSRADVRQESHRYTQCDENTARQFRALHLEAMAHLTRTAVSSLSFSRFSASKSKEKKLQPTRVKRREYGAEAECKGGGNGRSPRNPADQRHHPATITTCKNSEAAPPVIEPDSLWWEASSLTTAPLLHWQKSSPMFEEEGEGYVQLVCALYSTIYFPAQFCILPSDPDRLTEDPITLFICGSSEPVELLGAAFRGTEVSSPDETTPAGIHICFQRRCETPSETAPFLPLLITPFVSWPGGSNPRPALRLNARRWLDYSHPTKVKRVRFPAGSSPDSLMWTSCRVTPLVGGFSRGCPASPAVSFRRCSIDLIGSHDLDVKTRPDLFTLHKLPTQIARLRFKKEEGEMLFCSDGGGKRTGGRPNSQASMCAPRSAAATSDIIAVSVHRNEATSDIIAVSVHRNEATSDITAVSVHRNEATSDITAVSVHRNEATSDIIAVSVHRNEATSDIIAVSVHRNEATSDITAVSVHRNEATSDITAVSVHRNEATSDIIAVSVHRNEATSDIIAVSVHRNEATSDIIAVSVHRNEATSDIIAVSVHRNEALSSRRGALLGGGRLRKYILVGGRRAGRDAAKEAACRGLRDLIGDVGGGILQGGASGTNARAEFSFFNYDLHPLSIIYSRYFHTLPAERLETGPVHDMFAHKYCALISTRRFLPDLFKRCSHLAKGYVASSPKLELEQCFRKFGSDHVETLYTYHSPRGLAADAGTESDRMNYYFGLLRHEGNTARFARRSDEPLGVRVSVARIAPSLPDFGLWKGGECPPHSKLCRLALSAYIVLVMLSSDYAVWCFVSLVGCVCWVTVQFRGHTRENCKTVRYSTEPCAQRTHTLKFSIHPQARLQERFSVYLLFSGILGHDNYTTLDELRIHMYIRKISKLPVSASFQLASRPPTSAACEQHSLRAYLQVQEWLGHSLDPVLKLWLQTNGRLQHRGSKLDPRLDLRSSQITVAPFEFRAGLEIDMKFISNRRNWRFEISIRDQQQLSTTIKLDPGLKLGSFDLGSRKMVQPGVSRAHGEQSPLGKVEGRRGISIAMARCPGLAEGEQIDAFSLAVLTQQCLAGVVSIR